MPEPTANIQPVEAGPLRSLGLLPFLMHKSPNAYLDWRTSSAAWEAAQIEMPRVRHVAGLP